MCAEIGPLREVLAQQAISILIDGALPWAVRVAEEDLQTRVDPQIEMLRHLCPLIPGQGLSNLLGQGDDGARDGVADRLCPMTGERGSVLDPSGIGVSSPATHAGMGDSPHAKLLLRLLQHRYAVAKAALELTRAN